MIGILITIIIALNIIFLFSVWCRSQMIEALGIVNRLHKLVIEAASIILNQEKIILSLQSQLKGPSIGDYSKKVFSTKN